MDLWMGLVIFAAGQLVSLGFMWVERRWRKEDVAEAERRARLRSRYADVERYAVALRDYILMALSPREEWFVRGARERGPEKMLWALRKVLAEKY